MYIQRYKEQLDFLYSKLSLIQISVCSSPLFSKVLVVPQNSTTSQSSEIQNLIICFHASENSNSQILFFLELFKFSSQFIWLYKHWKCFSLITHTHTGFWNLMTYIFALLLIMFFLVLQKCCAAMLSLLHGLTHMINEKTLKCSGSWNWESVKECWLRKV